MSVGKSMSRSMLSRVRLSKRVCVINDRNLFFMTRSLENERSQEQLDVMRHR